MTRRTSIAAALCLALCLALQPVGPWAAAASGNGPPVDSVSARLSENAGLEVHTYWNGSDYLTESYITVSSGGSLRPVAVSHDTLCSVLPMETAAERLETKWNVTAVAGINGGFYTVATRVPVGIVVRDGALRSWGAGDIWMNVIGFLPDGGIRFGKPNPTLELTVGEKTLAVETLNQVRGPGLALFTDDFDSMTRASGDGWNLICIPSQSTVPLHGSLELEVETVSAAKGRVAIPEGRWILSLAGDTEEDAPAWLAALSQGERLTLSVASAEGWEEIESAVGLMHTLVENGVLNTGLEHTKDPRSAIGVKADGSLVLYTVDGRQEGYSVGAGLDDVARRMWELGCVNAGALDGGGSTSLRASLPGIGELNQVNRPSGATSREVANYIFLVKSVQPTGEPVRLALYPLDLDIMTGVDTALTVRAVDANGYPAPVPEGISFHVSEGLGTVTEGVFRGMAAGTGEITVSAPGMESDSIPVTVVEVPEELRIYGEQYGRRVESLSLDPGQEVDLTVHAYYNHVTLTSRDDGFQWETDEAAGTVDGTGHLTAAAIGGHGTLRVSAGGTETVVPIHVTTGLPFTDVTVDSPYYRSIRYTYDHQIFIGTEETVFDPEVVMNRGMLVTVLWRINGEPAAEKIPGFQDVEPEDWYGPAVAWAAERGIVNGYSETVFAPGDDLTREQIITILHRYAVHPLATAVVTGEAEAAAVEEPGAAEAVEAAASGSESLQSRPDAATISAWALSAMDWGNSTGVALTEPDGRLLPGAPMTRAEVAETLTRYLLLPEPSAEQEPQPGAEPEQEPAPDVEPEQEPAPDVEPEQEPAPDVEPEQEP